MTAPGAPTIGATGGDSQNTVTWGDGTGVVQDRKLYRSTASGFTPGPDTLIATNPEFPYTDSGLTNGTTYYYKGIASNSGGDSTASAQVSATPAAAAPVLSPLALSGSLTEGVAASGVTISGATPGSAIALNIAGLSVSGSGATRTVSGTPAASGALNATETLAGASNSPRVSALGTVAEAAPSGVIVNRPSEVFNVFPLNTVNVYRTGTGTESTFSTDYDHAARRAALAPANTFWVDAATGNNANPGTEAQPFRSMSKAAAAIVATGELGCMKVKGSTSGVPTRYSSLNTQTDGTTVYPDALTGVFTDLQMIVEPWAEGEAADSVIHAAGVTWLTTADPNIFRNTTAAAVAFDYSNMDDRRTARRLIQMDFAAGTPVETVIADMNALWAAASGLTDETGASYNTGVIARVTSGSTYIRTHDNRNPTGDANLVMAATTGGVQLSCSARNPLLFATGMGFLGGNSGAIYGLGSGGFRPLIIMSECRIIGSAGTQGGVLSSTGSAGQGADTIMHRVSCIGGGRDGFNYSGASNFVEIDCWTCWNGGAANANNGSTAHDNCRGLRVNTISLNNQRRSIHDVNNVVIWDCGPISSTRQPASAGDDSCAYANGIEGNAGTSTQYVDCLKVRDGIWGPPKWKTQVNHANGRIYYANLSFTPEVGYVASPGQVIPYTPS